MDKRYQVFVSSTYADLKDERRAVIQALMEMDCIPAGMELFPAADEEQFQFIKKIIDDCDYYILIIGGRYGSTTAEGISYTEKEYDYAKSKEMKVLAFVHSKPDDIPLGKSEKDPSLRERLDAFREKAKTNAIVKPWSDPKELPGLVALSLLATIKNHPATGWVRANQVANVDALRDLNDVRKRNDELQRHANSLAEQLKESTSEVEGLAGLDDPFEIVGTHWSSQTRTREWRFSINWGEIFAAIGPYVLAEPSDTVMEEKFSATMSEIYAKRVNASGHFGDFSLMPSVYQTVKLQLSALKLIELVMAATAGRSQALFWSLTTKGRATLIQLRTVKKPKATEGT